MGKLLKYADESGATALDIEMLKKLQ